MVFQQRTGFFSEYYLNLKNAQPGNFDKELEKLTECRNDRERIEFVDRLKCVRERDQDISVQRDYSGKDVNLAADFKHKGNLAFKNKQWLEAMLLYTKSYMALPEQHAKDRSIVLANRSATLYHLQKYDETLIDIMRALDCGYPKDLVYKLYERQARCHMAKHNYPSSISAFKKCITAMDDASLASDKRSKMNVDAMTMIKLLERDPRTAKQAEKQRLAGGAAKPSLSIPDEPEFLSAAVEFDQSREGGRFARATTDIKVGEEILVQKPFVAVLLEKFSKTHCEHCFVRTVVPVACAKCADIVYCSEKCLQEAAGSYHQYECGILPAIWRSGASINCHMALRIIASKPLTYFLKLVAEIDAPVLLNDALNLPSDDYRRVSHLERHVDKRSASNFFQHALMARFLNKCLLEAGYYGPLAVEEDLLNIGSLLLRNLEFIQFNTHEVAELHVSKVNKKTVFVGGALYPTLALFNHSCDPGIVRYFRGTTIHVSTIKPLEAGLEISENYGPIYTQEAREERQTKLSDLYRFDCTCDACLENWPTFEQMPTDIIRFRCDAPNNCRAVIEVPATCNDFMIKCVTCGESTNIFKGLKVMQDTEVMTRTAKRFYESADYSKALNKFIDLVRIMYEVLAPPFPDFCQCQQHVRDCFLHFGNVYNLE